MSKRQGKYDARTAFGKKWWERKWALGHALALAQARAEELKEYGCKNRIVRIITGWLIEMEAQEMFDGKTVNKPGRWEP